MIKKFLCLILLTILALNLVAGEEKPTVFKWTETGIRFSLNQAAITFTGKDVENKINYPLAMVEIRGEFFDAFSLGILAGYQLSSFPSVVEFKQLPLSLKVNNQKFPFFCFGVSWIWEPYYTGNFSILLSGDFLISLEKKKEWPIKLPIVKGTALVKNGFAELSANLLLKYDGWENLAIYAGGQLFLLWGKLSSEETIDGLKAGEDLKYRQKSPIGLMAGLEWDVVDRIKITLNGTLFARTMFQVSLSYLW